MSYRPERLAAQLQEEVSQLIEYELHDPRIGFATITGVRVSPDLMHARIYVSVLESEEKKKETLQALNNAAGFVRRAIGQRIRLRKSPEILFTLDESVERGDRLTRIIEDAVRDLPPASETSLNSLSVETTNTPTQVADAVSNDTPQSASSVHQPASSDEGDISPDADASK
jgi:ribosome-binding factor A